MDFITLTKENIASEHICCAIANNDDIQVASKKAWLADRMDDGLTFMKGDVRGKCFIEYIPAERAWAPVDAPGYMYIDCLWVSGQFKGQGNGALLMNECVRDCRSRGKAGLAVLSSKKKQPFLSDPKFLLHMGFSVADTVAPSYELYCLPFDDAAPRPRFRDSVREPKVSADGFVLYYSHQCPYPAKYVPIIADIAAKRGVPFTAVRFETAEAAQDSPAPFTTYSLFYNGGFVTHEIQSDKRFIKLLDDRGL